MSSETKKSERADPVDKVSKKLKHSRIKSAANLIWVCLPLVSFVFINPEWEARLIAVTGSIVIGNILLFYYGFKPKFDFAKGGGKFISQEREPWQRAFQWLLRGITICFACFMLYFVTTPVVTDCAAGIREGRTYLLEIKGQVQDNSFNFGMFFLLQDLRIVDGPRLDKKYMAVYFGHLARVGASYKFLVAPKSGIVLDWEKKDELYE